ncbi:hypothetical protein ACFQ0B_14215 [Nonomuraea thailandensis]
MTDETQAAKIRVNGAEENVLDTEAALLHAQDDPVASAAVDVAVETELLEDSGSLDARRESERQIAELTSKEQERVRGIQRELRTMGADVWPVARWWGYEIHLNESAALLAAEIPQLIGEISGAVLGSWLAPLIERSVRAKAEWIASIARPYGVRLASPWTAPGMLVPARQSGGDTSLYWTVHEPGDGWSPDQRFVDHFSVSGPALAEFQDRLFLAHRGADGDSSLWWTSYDAEEGWSDDQMLPGTSASRPRRWPPTTAGSTACTVAAAVTRRCGGPAGTARTGAPTSASRSTSASRPRRWPPTTGSSSACTAARAATRRCGGPAGTVPPGAPTSGCRSTSAPPTRHWPSTEVTSTACTAARAATRRCGGPAGTARGGARTRSWAATTPPRARP